MKIYVTYPDLTVLMRQKHATIQALAKSAGVCKATVERAKRGDTIDEVNFYKIKDALKNNVFDYVKGHRKKPTFVPEKKESQKPAYCPDISFADHPDMIHSIHLPNRSGVRMLPMQRSEEEIDRLHAYNQLMGRC